MATYVFSDIHGHQAPFDRVIERISPREDDVFVCLGDMIDRGPEPLGVIESVCALPNVRVLMGNHEEMMVDVLRHPREMWLLPGWELNGGGTTRAAFERLSANERLKLLGWLESLPRWDYAWVEGQLYFFVHAGIRPNLMPTPDEWSDENIENFLSVQYDDDLVWIRDEFWEEPTGLLNERGEGPIVIAGHTPTMYLEDLRDSLDRAPRNEEGLCQMIKVGANETNAFTADKWNIDCGAAGGSGFGQVLVLRLDDGKEFVEPVGFGE